MVSLGGVVVFLALAFWSFQLAPQCFLNCQCRSTGGLSSEMILLWTFGSLCTALYNMIARFSLPFLLQPNLFMIFSILCWAQCYYYQNRSHGLLLGTCLCLFVAGVELGVSSSLPSEGDQHWSCTLLGAASTAFFALGYVPQFRDIYRQGTVAGISRMFLCLDMTGALLSILALVLRTNFEPIAGACYLIVFVCDFALLVLSYLLPDGRDRAGSSPDGVACVTDEPLQSI
jgi:uncharacterized protein with PQ loop repeat